MLSGKERERERRGDEDQRVCQGRGTSLLLLQLQHLHIYQNARIAGQPRGLRARARLHAARRVRVHGPRRWPQGGEQ